MVILNLGLPISYKNVGYWYGSSKMVPTAVCANFLLGVSKYVNFADNSIKVPDRFFTHQPVVVDPLQEAHNHGRC